MLAAAAVALFARGKKMQARHTAERKALAKRNAFLLEVLGDRLDLGGPSALGRRLCWRRFSKRLGKRLGGRGGVHSTHGNCSFVKSPNTNLLELLAATPKQARLYSHGGRCAHRFSDVESALVACAAIPACGGAW